jgi:hypothetical protein
MKFYAFYLQLLFVFLIASFEVNCSGNAENIQDLKNLINYIQKPHRDENHYIYHRLMRKIIDRISDDNTERESPIKRLTKVRLVKPTDKPMYGRQQQWDLRFGK